MHRVDLNVHKNTKYIIFERVLLVTFELHNSSGDMTEAELLLSIAIAHSFIIAAE